MRISRRVCILALALAGMAAGQVWAQAAPLVFAVNEGVTYRVNPGATVERFRELSDELGKLLKRPVKVQAVTDYKELAAGLAEQRYDLAWVHPAHHSIRALSKNGYHLVAVTKGFTEYSASFMVRSDSPLKTLADLKGHKVGAPSEDSITSVIMRATLRDALGPQSQETVYVKLQDAVPFMVENNMVASGVTASRAVVKDWQAFFELGRRGSRRNPIAGLARSFFARVFLRRGLVQRHLGDEAAGHRRAPSRGPSCASCSSSPPASAARA
jgi:phosphonate transport system substrate-binding protein